LSNEPYQTLCYSVLLAVLDAFFVFASGRQGEHPMSETSCDVRAFRGLLAQERITYTHFASACGLSRTYLSHIMTGQKQPGELARIKIERGLAALGLKVVSYAAA
jgi:hypothetical protein